MHLVRQSSRHAPRDKRRAHRAEHDGYQWLARQRRSQRAGFTLVYVVLMLFGLLALAALVIDVGFARLTQRQMQTATDTAALEALRFRDEYPLPDWDPSLS